MNAYLVRNMKTFFQSQIQIWHIFNIGKNMFKTDQRMSKLTQQMNLKDSWFTVKIPFHGKINWDRAASLITLVTMTHMWQCHERQWHTGQAGHHWHQVDTCLICHTRTGSQTTEILTIATRSVSSALESSLEIQYNSVPNRKSKYNCYLWLTYDTILQIINLLNTVTT